MTNVKDLEEKKLILACHKCSLGKSKEHLFSNNSIYNDWSRWWIYDCPRKNNGKLAQIYKGNIVCSAAKYRKGQNKEEYIEFTQLLNSVSQWLYENYNEKVNRKSNHKMFMERLIELQMQHHSIIENLVSNHLSDKYVFQDISSPNPCRLREYTLVDKDTYRVIKGSYEYILNHLKDTIGKTEKGSIQ